LIFCFLFCGYIAEEMRFVRRSKRIRGIDPLLGEGFMI
jgi:hypothetical protein